MAETTREQIEARESEIRLKRTAMLLGAYEFMRQRYREVREGTHLARSFVAATVEDYLTQRRLIVGRDNITGRIQWHKVAGLMASAIAKNRPIQLVESDPDAPSTRLSRDNEIFAVLHGIAICAEGRKSGDVELVLRLGGFRTWFSDLVYTVHNDPANTAAFIMAFETLSLTHFPENLHHVE